MAASTIQMLWTEVKRLRKELIDVKLDKGIAKCKEAIKHLEYVKHLEAVVDQLPKLANGAPVTDPYSFVWHPLLGACMPIADRRVRPWAAEHYDNIRPIAECYDTQQAAAEAAKAK